MQTLLRRAGEPFESREWNGSHIRSVSQRGLAGAWAHLASQGLPAFDQFQPPIQVHDPKQVARGRSKSPEINSSSGPVSRTAGGRRLQQQPDWKNINRGNASTATTGDCQSSD